MLKSSFASSSKIGFMSSLFLYTSINHLASTLDILQCSGSSKAWLTMIERFRSLFWLINSWRCFFESSLASSKIFSPSNERNEASYKDRIPLVSSQRYPLKLPSSMKLSKTSALSNPTVIMGVLGTQEACNQIKY